MANRKVVLMMATLALAGCKKKNDAGQANAAADSAVEISPANITELVQEEIRSGPVISGTLAPRREATIRAEVGGSVLQTYADQGQAVAGGAVLARIDDHVARDAYLSAKSGVTSAGAASKAALLGLVRSLAAELARRNLERAEKLSQAGAIADRDLEAARVAAQSAQSQLADAAARLASAEKQLASTQVRAPFRGVISARPVNAGDVVSPGSALFSMVDPNGGMKFEAAVPADQLSGVRVGAPVQFHVHGYANRLFNGVIERVNPAADPATGQIGVYVGVPNTAGLVSGLYAEGRVGTQAKMTLTAPLNALLSVGDTSFLMRVKGGRVNRVEVQIGVRDEEGERAEIIGPVAAGDTVLVGAAVSISPNSLIRVQSINDQAGTGK